MDLNAFADENFDAIIWINNTLKNLDKAANKDALTASLVTKLQTYIHQVNSSLEDTSQQFLSSLPRIIHDTKNLQNEAMMLKDKMRIVKEEIAKVEHSTAESIAKLEHLDKIKTKLQIAKDGLHEADNWAVLANELEEIIESGNIENIADKLVSMQRSLKILQNVADFEDRRLQLEGLKNRLEAMASPSIVQAFTSANIEQATLFAKIFSSIERLPQLIKYYHKCQRGTLLQKWRNQLEIEQDESVNQWMHNFYDALLSNWHTQMKWLNTVFPQQSAVLILMDVYTDLLTSVDPSYNECIDAALKQTSDKLGSLIEVKETSKQFSINLSNLINSSAGKINKEAFLSLAQAIYSPYIPYVSKYATYEQSYLTHKVSSLDCIKEDIADSVHALGLSVATIVDNVRESKKRCQLLTENCGYPGLLTALKAFYQHFTDQFKIILRQIDRARGFEEDWNMFQVCLSLLQAAGEVLLNFQKFDKDLTSSVMEVKSLEGIEYKYLLLNSNGQKEYDSLMKCAKEAKELVLLSSVDKELNDLCSEIHYVMYKIVFVPISVHIDSLQESLKKTEDELATLSSDIPDYFFTPQEYITQIGQYLMKLLQHMEPFLMQDNPSLRCALKAADSQYSSLTDEDENGLAKIMLGLLARGTCQTYCDEILKIHELKSTTCRQLVSDIEYLKSVLEDIDLSLTEALQQISTLLKIPADQYQAQSTGCSARLVAAVRQMRNITSG